MNPYSVLGLARTAKAKEVRAAYRKLAKQHHPDLGGDPKRFAELKLAHDILNDPERRARFDNTGDASEKSADNSLAEILSHLSVAMQVVVAQNHTNLTRTDLIGGMRAKLNGDLTATRKEIAEISPTIAKWSLTAGRIAVKRGKPNYLADLCRANMKALQERLGEHEKRAANIEKALKLLDDFSFERDSAPTPTYTTAAINWRNVGL